MRCADCCLWWQDEGENFCYCHADPKWLAPCEVEDNYIEKENYYDEE